MDLSTLAEVTDVTTIGYSRHQSNELLKARLVKRICVHREFVTRGLAGGFHVSCVIGFPFGEISPEEIPQAILAGAQELDISLPLSLLEESSPRRGIIAANPNIAAWVESLKLPGRRDITYKFILHTDLIEKLFPSTAIQMIKDIAEQVKIGSGSIYLRDQVMMKTCTGYGPGGATALAVRTLRESGHRVKASGGIRTLAQVEELLASGAQRLGIGFSSFMTLMKELGEQNA